MSPWAYEAWRLTVILVLASFIGLLTGQLSWSLVIALGFLLSFHARQAYRLDRWLRGVKRVTPPEGRGVWADIHLQIHQIKRRSRQRKRRLAGILKEFVRSTEAMPDGAVVLSPKLRILWFNSAAQRWLDLQAPADNNQLIVNLVRAPAFVQYLSAGDYSEPVTIPSPVHPGVVLSLQLVPYGEDQRLLLVRDVTRVHQLDQVRRDFVANASHELRTPLTVLTGYLEVIRDDAKGPMRHWEGPVQEMQAQVRRMTQLVEDLLLLSRLDESESAGDVMPVDLPMLLSQVCEDARAMAGDRLQITLDAVPEHGLRGVESELRGVFDNLLSNAVKYTPDGGSIHVRSAEEAGELVVSVSDTGIGIADHHLPRLTERFYRVDSGRGREQGGTGLGLAIVKHGLQRHDALLTIESQPDVGSTFTCHFPSSRIVLKLRGTTEQAPKRSSV